MNLAQPNVMQDSRTLWIGDIEAWMDENYLANIFRQTSINPY